MTLREEIADIMLNKSAGPHDAADQILALLTREADPPSDEALAAWAGDASYAGDRSIWQRGYVAGRAAHEKELAELRAALQTITNARQTDGETIARLQHALQKAEARILELESQIETEDQIEMRVSAYYRERHSEENVVRLGRALRKAEVERDSAVRLLHMLDNPEARHPDVAEFLDGVESQLPVQAPADAEAEARPMVRVCARCGDKLDNCQTRCDDEGAMGATTHFICGGEPTLVAAEELSTFRQSLRGQP